LVDYHIHTGDPFLDQNPPHAIGTWEDYFKAAGKFNIIPGNSNHAPHYFGKDGKNLHSYENKNFIRGAHHWEPFLEKSLDFREKRKSAFMGLEIDFFEDVKEEKYLEAIETGYLNFHKNPSKKVLKRLERRPLNYLIISTHFVFGKPFDVSPEEYMEIKKLAGGDPKKIIQSYWESILASTYLAKSIKNKTPIKKIIMGHLDLIKIISKFEKKFGNTSPINFDTGYEAVIEKILKNIQNFGISLEFNTAGVKKNIGTFPSDFILTKAKKLQIPITFGSDSHAPYSEDFSKNLLLFKEFAVS